ncbi:LuxR family transcriptional regulator [Nocardia terpenica]|uniref:LuxR family transcriptional regulator n=2 Tax=Nocardia terpenica TaxID=455432 RepID=A0A291RP29_9NOCA|nr:LuxR family transcriptional regulator [Nocardia terpenica]
MVSAAPGSGKTVLVRSWIRESGAAERAAWVTVTTEMHEPQQFWLAVSAALRATDPGAALVRPVSAAPGLDGWALAERLLTDLAPLDEPLWLVIDDLHELGSDQALRQLELLVLRAPPRLRFVFATRRDGQLGLHRLRLDGELTEIRAADLRFSPAEAQQLFAGAGLDLPPAAAAILCERTEGWAAGLRLAALSLAGHADPARFAREFSGTERTVAEYLLAETLNRHSERVRRLLLRTSVLERVNGELADLLTGHSGGERILQDLEQANAFAVSLDAGRSWFRYHQMFADLLRLELRRTMPEEITGLHRAVSEWFAAHGYPVDAIRHAQAAKDWERAADLLTGHWPGLHLDGQAATVHDLLAAFPESTEAHPGLAAVTAADELAHGSLEKAEHHLGLAQKALAAMPPPAPGRLAMLLAVVRLLVAVQRGNLPTVADEAQRLQAMADAPETVKPDLGQDLRALALIHLGSTELWAARFDDAERHLERGVALAHRIGRPYLEFVGLAHHSAADARTPRSPEVYRSLRSAAEHGRRAIELAERHGWTDRPPASIAAAAVGSVLVLRGRPDEAASWIDRAERALRAETDPVVAVGLRHIRGLLELARGRAADALAVLRTAEPLAARLAVPAFFVPQTGAFLAISLTRLGRVERAEQTLARLGDLGRGSGEVDIAHAEVALAQGDPRAAITAVAPILDSVTPGLRHTWRVHAHLLVAIARETLGDPTAAERALERALDLAEPDGMIVAFLLHPAPDLLRRHARRTAHAALVTDIRGLLTGHAPATVTLPRPPVEPLRDSEIRVLRYLPTNLTLPEIARELGISHNTVKTHIGSLYTKLDTHGRTETVTRARALGLLAHR